MLLRESTAGGLFVYRTRDGGNTWRRGAVLPWPAVPLSPTTFGGSVWAFADAAHGWVAWDGRFFVTADGGQTWRAVATTANLLNVWQLDVLTPAVGWVVQRDIALTGGQLLRTTDGGRTWTPRTPHLAPLPARSPTTLRQATAPARRNRAFGQSLPDVAARALC